MLKKITLLACCLSLSVSSFSHKKNQKSIGAKSLKNRINLANLTMLNKEIRQEIVLLESVAEESKAFEIQKIRDNLFKIQNEFEKKLENLIEEQRESLLIIGKTVDALDTSLNKDF